MENAFDDPGIAELYDAASNPRLDFAYCQGLMTGVDSVLDLGCGTGEFLAMLDPGVHRTGADPAQAMLDIAAVRPGGETCEWVCADARSMRLGQTYDLIVLTGHAFQVFLTDEDQFAVFTTIAAHLAPGGTFIFDSRNPDYPPSKERRIDETLRRFLHPESGEVEAWNESRYDEATGVLTYANHYRIVRTGERRSAHAQIRYTPQPELGARMASAGLKVSHWLGDWHGTAFQPRAPEVIPVGSLA